MVISFICLTFATLFAILGIAEISFPETFITFTDKEFVLVIFPKAWKYGLQTGICLVALAALLVIPAWRANRVFTEKVLENHLRLGIGGMFIFASIFKIQSPLTFATLVAQYQFLPEFANNFFALFMPQLELWFGIALIFSPFVREAAFAIFLMFLSFIVALSWALFHDLGITCGCFELEGAQDKAEAWTALIRDLVLIGPNIWLMTRKNKSLITLWKKN
ncbi:MAG: hypothetical protein LBR60_03410 [Fibrobacter sp.]|jgi:uncharacterized membrane protein YphA (DoxX/SURF4 family)|nr:hypothetical protein [Fibrobacter sp.]